MGDTGEKGNENLFSMACLFFIFDYFSTQLHFIAIFPPFYFLLQDLKTYANVSNW